MSDLLESLRQALADRYAVERELGRGGMATVFLAEDTKHRRPVAIKVLHAELAAALGAERFLREIQIAARLQHPHILPLYDSGAAGGVVYYVMPYVEGESLRDRLTREQQLSLEDALRIATEVAGALAYAHSRGIVHRDIKPENIMLSGGTAVVTDFGIARAVTAAGEGRQLTQTGTIIGTPAYMSPEQATGQAEIDGRSDEYSLACVVYEMLVGEPPFTGPTAQAIIARHSMDVVSPPSIVRATIPDAVEGAILRALSKVPADRYPTTALFAEALNVPSAATGAVRRATLGRGVLPRRIAWRWVAPLAAAVAVVGGYFLVRSLRPARVATAGGGALDPRHLAVLYFTDDSKGHTLGYLSDGLTEALIDQLSQVATLHVVSKNGASRFRGGAAPADSVARVLNVGSVIEGSVAGAGGDKLHVSVRLVDGGSGDVVQRAGFELPATALLEARDSLAQEASQLLRSWLGEEIRVRELQAGTANVGAWTLVLRAQKGRRDGEELLRKNDASGGFGAFDAADSLLAQAAAADPQWVTPVVLRGQVALRRSRLLQSKPKEALQWADVGRGYAERALKLDRRSAEALELRGTLEYWRALLGVPPDPAGQAAELAAAQKDLEAAVDIDPKLASAYNTLSALYYKTKDRAAAALAARQALAADAYLTFANTALWRLFASLYDIEQFDQARAACEEGRRRFAQDYHFAECQLWLMTAPAVQPNVAAAWRLLDEVDHLVPAPLKTLQVHLDRTVVGGVIGRAGLLDSARRVLIAARLGTDLDPQLQILCMESVMRTMIGDRDEAIDLLKRCIAANPGHVFQRGGDVHWWWRNLQSHPRFRDVVGTKR